MRPRQIIIAVLLALGVGALLSSGALVGLAERQPLGTQRTVALGAAELADRVAQALYLDRPAEELAAAFDGEEEVYDVEALLARASATTAQAPPPAAAPPPPEDRDDPEAGPPTDPGEDRSATGEPAEPGGDDHETGPPADGDITPIIGVDCVRVDPDGLGPDSDEDPGDGSGGGNEAPDPATGAEQATGPDRSSSEGEPDTDAGADRATAPTAPTATPGGEGQTQDLDAGASDAGATADDDPGDDRRIATRSSDAGDPEGTGGPPRADATTGEPDGEAESTTGDDGADHPSVPGECPPGYEPAGGDPAEPGGTTEPEATTDDAEQPGGDEDATPEVTFDAPRTPTAEDPLSMYVGGDSISRDLGEGLARITPAELVRIDLDPRPATGLSRPDFFDWSHHLAGVLTESSPDVLVVMFGANDFQNVEYEGQILDRFEPEWLDLYRERVDRIMTLLSQPDTQAVWIGQPPVRESRLSGGLAMLNGVYAEIAERHPQVTFVDTWDLFSGDGGGYVDEIDGVRLRREDGVHLTIDGGNHLAEAVWRVIGPSWGLE